MTIDTRTVEVLAQSFELREFYPKTVWELRSIAKDLEAGKKSNFDRRIALLYNILEGEFINSLPTGQRYRRECFNEMKITILRAVERLEYKFQDSTSLLFPIIKRMEEVDHNLIPVSMFCNSMVNQLTDPDKYDVIKPILFHMSAYMYLVDVEGIFDELARIFYFLTKASKHFTPSKNGLDNLTAKQIAYELHPVPIFLRDLEIKLHLRNAIGHARATYNAERDEVHFTDVDVYNGRISFEETYSMTQFQEFWMELIDASAAFRFSVELLKLYDYI